MHSNTPVVGPPGSQVGMGQFAPNAASDRAAQWKLKLCNWNPMSLRAPGRMSGIATLTKCDVLLLPGTRIRATPKIISDAPCVKQVVEGKLFYHWGWEAGPFVNKHAGVSLALGRRLSDKKTQRYFFSAEATARTRGRYPSQIGLF